LPDDFRQEHLQNEIQRLEQRVSALESRVESKIEVIDSKMNDIKEALHDIKLQTSTFMATITEKLNSLGQFGAKEWIKAIMLLLVLVSFVLGSPETAAKIYSRLDQMPDEAATP
jgi:hypothetical protein